MAAACSAAIRRYRCIDGSSDLTTRNQDSLPKAGECYAMVCSASKRSMLMRLKLTVTGLVLSSIVFAPASAQAQVKVDVTKITCDQFVHDKIEGQTPLYLAAWISGYYHAKRNNQIVDRQALEENTTKVKNYCYDEKNFKVPVMQAVETVLGKSSSRLAHDPGTGTEKVDVTEITCDEFVARPAKIATPLYLAAWISGYYNAKRNNRILDLRAFEENMNKVQSYCYDEKNFKMPIMEAVETVLGKSSNTR